MKWRTNQERAARKERKQQELIEVNKNRKQVHTIFHNKPGYHAIISSVKEKTSLITITAAHARDKIKKVILFPRILWINRTYVSAIHGPLKKEVK